MIPPTDPLEVALSEMPCLLCRRGWIAHTVRAHWQPDPAALAAIARKCMREQMPVKMSGNAMSFESADHYNAALVDVAKELGLEERP